MASHVSGDCSRFPGYKHTITSRSILQPQITHIACFFNLQGNRRNKNTHCLKTLPHYQRQRHASRRFREGPRRSGSRKRLATWLRKEPGPFWLYFGCGMELRRGRMTAGFQLGCTRLGMHACFFNMCVSRRACICLCMYILIYVYSIYTYIGAHNGVPRGERLGVLRIQIRPSGDPTPMLCQAPTAVGCVR